MRGKLLDVKVGTRLRDRDKRSGGRVVQVIDPPLRPGSRCTVQTLLLGRPYGIRSRITPVSSRWEVVS